MSWFYDYCFAHDGMFMIPIEQISREGLSEEFAEQIVARTELDSNWTDLFSESFQNYWMRCNELAKNSPAHWFRPRVQNVGIVTEPKGSRPYFQPIHKNSWLFYATDFDPEESNIEYAVFQILQTERMGLIERVAPVLSANLSYWLLRQDQEVELFAQACEQSTRPDAEAYRVLAKALGWIRTLHHEVLKPPLLMSHEQTVTIPGTGLMIPQSKLQDLNHVLETWNQVTQNVLNRYLDKHSKRKRNHVDELSAWLREEKPRVVITGAKGRLLWDINQPGKMGAIFKELKGATSAAVISLRADLEIIADRSAKFADSVVELEDLPLPAPRTADQSGLSYMYLGRREIAYNLAEEDMLRLRVPAPPFERFMLGARTIHEWGHLATEANWVLIPSEREAEHASLLKETEDAFEELYAKAPANVRSHCHYSLQVLTEGERKVGAALTRVAFHRTEDFQSNLMSQRFLQPEERETYIRNNLRSHIHEYTSEGLFQQLARYAYEFQYLRFSNLDDPYEYFLKSTWFSEQYLESGFIEEERFKNLLDVVGRVCDCYTVDETRFKN